MRACRGPAAGIGVSRPYAHTGVDYLGDARDSANAELDRIARNKFERSVSAYRWCERCRASVTYPEEDFEMTRPLVSKRVILHEVGTLDHMLSEDEK